MLLQENEKYGSPLIVLDFGTATTFDCINKNGDYLGGVICPGIESAASVLHQKAAKLPKIELMFPPQSNWPKYRGKYEKWNHVWIGELIEGIINRIKKELPGDPKVVATGGLAHRISKRSKLIDQ